MIKANWADYYPSEFPYVDADFWPWETSANDQLSCPLMLHSQNGWFNEASAAELVHVELDWLAVLDHGTGSDNGGNYSFFDKVRRTCLGAWALDDDNSDHFGKHPDLTCMATGLGAGIAEGLSKVPYELGIHAWDFVKNGPAKTLSLWIASDHCKIDAGDPSIFHDLFGDWIISNFTPSQM